jgi:hypothetical protein
VNSADKLTKKKSWLLEQSVARDLTP